MQLCSLAKKEKVISYPIIQGEGVGVPDVAKIAQLEEKGKISRQKKKKPIVSLASEKKERDRRLKVILAGEKKEREHAPGLGKSQTGEQEGYQ